MNVFAWKALNDSGTGEKRSVMSKPGMVRYPLL
jgi:hypothetical protein